MSLPEPAAEATDLDDAGDAGIVSSINITPLTDVILVLLIIFMVSSSAMVDAAREGRLEVSLPRAGSAASTATSTPPLIIGIGADGRPFVDGAYLEVADLDGVLRAAHARAPDQAIIVDADGGLAHRQVVDVIDRIRAAGFDAVGIGAQAP